MLLENQLDWTRIVDLTLFSIFESVSFLLIQTLVTELQWVGRKYVCRRRSCASMADSKQCESLYQTAFVSFMAATTVAKTASLLA